MTCTQEDQNTNTPAAVNTRLIKDMLFQESSIMSVQSIIQFMQQLTTIFLHRFLKDMFLIFWLLTGSSCHINYKTVLLEHSNQDILGICCVKLPDVFVEVKYDICFKLTSAVSYYFQPKICLIQLKYSALLFMPYYSSAPTSYITHMY